VKFGSGPAAVTPETEKDSSFFHPLPDHPGGKDIDEKRGSQKTCLYQYSFTFAQNKDSEPLKGSSKQGAALQAGKSGLKGFCFLKKIPNIAGTGAGPSSNNRYPEQ